MQGLTLPAIVIQSFCRIRQITRQLFWMDLRIPPIFPTPNSTLSSSLLMISPGFMRSSRMPPLLIKPSFSSYWPNPAYISQQTPNFRLGSEIAVQPVLKPSWYLNALKHRGSPLLNTSTTVKMTWRTDSGRELAVRAGCGLHGVSLSMQIGDCTRLFYYVSRC